MRTEYLTHTPTVKKTLGLIPRTTREGRRGRKGDRERRKGRKKGAGKWRGRES